MTDYLRMQDGHIQITMSQLFQILGMVNQKYSNKEYRNNLANINADFNNWQVHQFYLNSLQRLRTILTSSLNNIQKRKIIDYDMVYMIVDKENSTYIADKNETENIHDIETSVLFEFGFPNIKYLHLKGKTDMFYTRVNQLLREMYGYQSTFKVFDITLLIERDTLNNKERDNLKHHLNKLILDAICESIKCVYSRNQKQWKEATEKTKQKCIEENLVWGEFRLSDKEINEYTGAFKYSVTFVEIQKLLMEELILLH